MRTRETTGPCGFDDRSQFLNCKESLANTCENLSLPEFLIKADLANNRSIHRNERQFIKKVKMHSRISLLCICFN